ncbi:MAG: PhnD/SsuA/transferrin family substrate-binding protein [Cyanobacteria bacterium SBLK]|nr:PhnD/SsuA/transferrin family substrate-binding protein [Cyanobacteria bacterium SBLK]
MKRRFFLGYSCLFLASCSAARHNSTKNEQKSEKPAIADWPETLRFTITDADGEEELNRDYQVFRRTLEGILACKIEFYPVESYVAAAPAMLAGNLDLAWAGPLEYLILQARAKAIPLVALKRPHFRTSISVRGDRGIQTVADLKGKTIEINEIGSTGSHLGTVKLLLEAGLNPKTDVTFTASDENTLSKVVSGEVDALGRPEHRYQALLQQEGLSAEDYPAIAIGEPIPGDVFVVNPLFEPEIIGEIRSRLLANNEKLMAAMWSVEELKIRFKDAFFEPVNQSEYDEIRALLQTIGQENLLR